MNSITGKDFDSLFEKLKLIRGGPINNYIGEKEIAPGIWTLINEDGCYPVGMIYSDKVREQMKSHGGINE